jgi:antitoxin component YwqK of YwqJK toxin-antitoxin module
VKSTLLYIFIFIATIAPAQLFKQLPQNTGYDAAIVVDAYYGIKMYEKLNFMIGGDSVRNNKKGYSCQGWVEDTYQSGSIIHKGYYEDGQLKTYKNFYENGVIERSFKVVDFKRCNMQLFYADGKLKSDITYYDGSPQLWTDYYANGQIEYQEENSKDMEYLILRKSFSLDGNPQEIFELIDKKKKIYSKKEYNENLKLQAEGFMKFNSAMVDYQKNGDWKVYDENGNVKEEKWVNGEIVTN